VYWIITVLVCLVGVPISQRCSEILGEKDPSSVVIDEVAGVLIALGFVQSGPIWVLALAWILFRVFDIQKPWLIDKAQYLPPAGMGIMADDVLAGLVAGLISWGVLLAAPLL
jgi:phosphatidylglycerophosphatase A